MNEIKTIGDLKSLGLLKGLYSGLVDYYYRLYSRESNFGIRDTRLYKRTCGSDLCRASMERYFLKEPIKYLKLIDYSKISNFGHGKKEAQMKTIFEFAGLDWEERSWKN